MKSLKFAFFLLLFQIFIQTAYTQTATVDTVLAGKLYQTANKGLKNREFQNIDTYISSFKNAAEIYREHQLWNRYLNAKCGLVECYARKSMLTEAKSTAKEIVERSRQHFGEINAFQGNAWHNTGLCYYYNGNPDSAMVYFRKGLDARISYFGNINKDVAWSYNNIGITYDYIGEYDSTLYYYFKALEIRKELFGEKHSDVAISYDNIGNVYTKKGEYNLAIEYHYKAIKVSREILGEEHLETANFYDNIFVDYFYMNRYDSLLKYINKALEIRKNILGEKAPDVARTYDRVAFAYSFNNEYDSSLLYYSKALKIRKEIFGEKHPEVADSYQNVGTIYIIIGEFDSGLQNHLNALQIRKELFGENNLATASSYWLIGRSYREKGDHVLALEYLHKSVQIKKELLGEINSEVADIYVDIGLTYREHKDLDISIEYFLKSLDIHKDLFGENHSSVAIDYNNLGVDYYDKEEYDKAKDYYLRALRLWKEQHNEENIESAGILSNLGMIYLENKEYDQAEEYYRKALHTYKVFFGENNIDVAKMYNNIGFLYYNRIEYGKALKYFHKGIASSFRHAIDTTSVYSVPQINDYSNWAFLLQALQMKGRILSDSYIQSTGPSFTANLKTAILHYQACDTLINQLRQSFTTKEDKISLGDYASTIYEEAIDACRKLISEEPEKESYYKELAFYFSEENKSSILLEALAGSEAQKFAGIPDTLLKEENNLQGIISYYQKLLAENPDSDKEELYSDRLFNANRQYDELISTFENRYVDYFELKYNRKPATVYQIQEILNDQTAIISYFIGDSSTTIFTLTKNDLDVKSIPAFKNLADTIQDFRYGLIYPYSERFNNIYKYYAFRLFRKLIPENIDSGVKNLVIIPDAELSMIPFETLITDAPENKEWQELAYLIKKYNISYSYSANLFYKTYLKEVNSKIDFSELDDWLAFAPVFGENNSRGISIKTRELLEKLNTESEDTSGTRGIFLQGGYISPLPGTESEVQAIFRQFDENSKKASVYINNSASEEKIKSDELGKYRIIHLATHGFVNTEYPELSGILFAQDTASNEDGMLYSGEIYNLKLNADLTILSACETGLGKIIKGEGIMGLTRALLYSGTRNIIVSLWRVADESTSELMIDFYKNFLEAREGDIEYSQALRQAKLKMIDEGKYAHPFYWSPFILIGK